LGRRGAIIVPTTMFWLGCKPVPAPCILHRRFIRIYRNHTLQPCYKHCFAFFQEGRLTLYRMNRGFTFILLLITLTGTFFPCCLVDECNNEEIAGAQRQNKHQQESTCSPFFPCATCAGFTAMLKPVQVVQLGIQIYVHPETIVFFNIKTYVSSFWQPPRSC
jgi:hypothetical protein